MRIQRSKTIIPSDWDGESWACYRITWPNSPQWIAVLRGLIVAMAYGRTWDERTGVVVDTQLIGMAIEGANMPLVPCDNEAELPDSGSTEVTCPACGGAVIVEENYEMPVTRIVPIDEGGLEIPYDDSGGRVAAGLRWYMGECCPHDIYFSGGGVSLPVGTPPVNPPPGDIASATSCTKAQRMAVVTYNIMQAAFAQIGLEDTALGFLDFAGAIKSLFPAIDFGETELYNLFYFVYALKVAGLESETENAELVDWLACAWSPIFDDGAEGITVNQYKEATSLLTAVMRAQIGDSSYAGFGKTMRNAWERAFRSIGSGDAEKLTTNLIPTGLEDCSCPGDTLPDWVDEGDWYLVLDFQGSLPLGCALYNDNGETIITARGAELLADTSGSEKTGVYFTPLVTGGVVNRVKFEMLWGPSVSWVSLGLHSSFGGNYLQDPNYFDTVHDTNTGIATYENTDLDVSLTGAELYILAECNAQVSQDPIAPVFARVILQGTGPHPWGL